MLAQFASSSRWWSEIHRSMRRRAVLERRAPAVHDAVETEDRVIALMFSVKVGRLVLLVEHADDDAEEGRDDGHGAVSVRSCERSLTDRA